MKNKVVAGLILSLAVLVGVAKGRSALEYVEPSSITSVQFTKKCQPISGTLAECNGVMVTFAAVSFKPTAQGVHISKEKFGGFELK